MERYQGKEWAEGLRPFIVPPTNAKQTFLEHPVLQTMWAKAAKVLANCDLGRIIMVGYSMPETDLTVLSMLRESIRSNLRPDGRLWPEILVVNPVSPDTHVSPISDSYSLPNTSSSQFGSPFLSTFRIPFRHMSCPSSRVLDCSNPVALVFRA